MSSLKTISPDLLALLAALLGIILADNLNLNDQNIVGNFLENIGQTILTVNAQASAQNEKQQQQLQNQYITKQIELMKSQIELLEQMNNGNNS